MKVGDLRALTCVYSINPPFLIGDHVEIMRMAAVSSAVTIKNLSGDEIGTTYGYLVNNSAHYSSKAQTGTNSPGAVSPAGSNGGIIGSLITPMPSGIGGQAATTTTKYQVGDLFLNRMNNITWEIKRIDTSLISGPYHLENAHKSYQTCTATEQQLRTSILNRIISYLGNVNTAILKSPTPTAPTVALTNNVGEQFNEAASGKTWQIISIDRNDPYPYRLVSSGAGHNNCVISQTRLDQLIAAGTWVPSTPLNPSPYTVAYQNYLPSGAALYIEADRTVQWSENSRPGCECGNKGTPKGQGHSHWCQMFEQEF